MYLFTRLKFFCKKYEGIPLRLVDSYFDIIKTKYFLLLYSFPQKRHTRDLHGVSTADNEKVLMRYQRDDHDADEEDSVVDTENVEDGQDVEDEDDMSGTWNTEYSNFFMTLFFPHMTRLSSFSFQINLTNYIIWNE